jgi:hypothetical protein
LPVIELCIVADFLKQATLLGITLDRAAKFHAALVFLLAFGAGGAVALRLRAIEITSHCVSPSSSSGIQGGLAV